MLKYTLALFSAFLIFQFSSAQKYNAEVLKLSTICQAIDGELNVTNEIKVQINNRAGDHYGLISVPYSKNEKITGFTAYITDTEGNLVRKLKKEDIIDRSAYSDGLYSDHFIKGFQLKHSSYPYIVCFTFTYNIKYFLQITDWDPTLNWDIPTSSASLKVIIPNDYKIKYKNILIEEPKVSKDEAFTTYEWQTQYLKPLKEENFSRMTDCMPQVIVVPQEFKYWNPGNQDSWQSFGDWIYNLGEGLDELPEEEKLSVSKLITGQTDKKEIAKILYHYLQDRTRYIAVTIGVGGLKPYPAEYVSKNKYGDCKALTNYMKALLRYAGIESYYTIVYSGYMPSVVYEDLPHNQFNHAILAIPFGNDTIWLENTNKNIPFGHLGLSTQNRPALLISKGKSKLVRTPKLMNDQVLEVQSLKYDISIDKSANLEFHGKYKGPVFSTLNGIYTGFKQEDQDKTIRNVMPFENYEVLKWKLNKVNRDSAFIDLYVDLKLNNFLNPLGSDYFLVTNPLPIPQFIKPATRTLPVIISYPIVHQDSILLNLPEGFIMKGPLDPVEITTSFGNYKLSVSTDGNKILVKKSFLLNPGNYPLDQYTDLYNFIESSRKADQLKIVVKQLSL